MQSISTQSRSQDTGRNQPSKGASAAHKNFGDELVVICRNDDGHDEGLVHSHGWAASTSARR